MNGMFHFFPLNSFNAPIHRTQGSQTQGVSLVTAGLREEPWCFDFDFACFDHCVMLNTVMSVLQSQ